MLNQASKESEKYLNSAIKHDQALLIDQNLTSVDMLTSAFSVPVSYR